MKSYNKIVIGIDQSYERTGISIAVDNKLLKVTSINFRGCTNNIEKRKLLSNIIHRILKQNSQKSSECLIICERIRTFTGGNKLRPDYLKSTGALIAMLADVAYDYNVPVYSVDTRAWKNAILGSTKTKPKHEGEIKPEKMAAIEFIESLGFDCKERDKDGGIKYSVRGKNKGKIKYDDDKADGACIALYGFIPKSKQKLELET